MSEIARNIVEGNWGEKAIVERDTASDSPLRRAIRHRSGLACEVRLLLGEVREFLFLFLM